MSIIQGTVKGGGGSTGEVYTYPIEDSLRFDGSSYLSRTPSTAGNRKTWTWSSWVKRGNLGSVGGIFEANHTKDDQTALLFETADTLLFTDRPLDVRNIDLRTTQVFRDVGAWCHIVVAVDITQSTSTNRVKLYVNGSQVTSLSTSSYPSSSTYDTAYWNNTNSHRIGYYQGNSSNYFNGYLANIQFIDGQALDPYFFGKFKDNIWVPYNAFSTAGSGTATASDGDTATDSYGTNGFHLDFADSSNIGNDVSGNNNDWTVN